MNGLFIILQSLIKSALSLEIDTDIMVNPRILRVLLKSLFVILKCIIPSAFLVQQYGEVDLALEMIGIDF